MQARMSNPAMIVPDAMQALQALAKALATSAATVNLWNRLNASTRQVAGEWARGAAPA